MFSSQPILHLSSQSMYRREHSALASVLSICVPPRKTTIAASKSFSSVASNIWNSLPNHLSSIPALPAFRMELSNMHLFTACLPRTVAAKSGKIKPAGFYRRFVDTPPTTAIAQPGNTMPPSLKAFHGSSSLWLVKWFISHRLHTERMCKSCVTYLLTYLLTYMARRSQISGICRVTRVSWNCVSSAYRCTSRTRVIRAPSLWISAV